MNASDHRKRQPSKHGVATSGCMARTGDRDSDLARSRVARSICRRAHDLLTGSDRERRGVGAVDGRGTAEIRGFGGEGLARSDLHDDGAEALQYRRNLVCKVRSRSTGTACAL